MPFPAVSRFRSPPPADRRRSEFDGIVALGVVIRGDTPHFDYVAGECARGIMDVQLATGVPIGFGMLTTENLAQAEERADPQRVDKGYEAAVAAASVAVIEPIPSARSSASAFGYGGRRTAFLIPTYRRRPASRSPDTAGTDDGRRVTFRARRSRIELLRTAKVLRARFAPAANLTDVESVWFDGGAVGFVDQRALPQAVERKRRRASMTSSRRFATLAVRGAPAIGIFGAYGVALAARLHGGQHFDVAAERIRNARPTAVNLAWAVDRVLARADGDYLAEARAIHDEQREIDRRIGQAAIESVPGARATC